jgi:uridine monophosphate synthetase
MMFCMVACVLCWCLQEQQLVVTDVVVLIDREQGGAAHLAKNGLNLHAAFKLSAMLDILQKHQLVDDTVAQKVRTFITENQTQLPAAGTAAAAAAAASKQQRLTYEARAAVAKNSVARACLELMARKKTNLAVAADVSTADEMLQLAEATGPHICVFKTHVDIFDR